MGAASKKNSDRSTRTAECDGAPGAACPGERMGEPLFLGAKADLIGTLLTAPLEKALGTDFFGGELLGAATFDPVVVLTASGLATGLAGLAVDGRLAAGLFGAGLVAGFAAVDLFGLEGVCFAAG